MSERVVVTGATGFVAGHLIKLLLSEGYHVVGTVRDLKREEKLSPLKQLPNADKHLELKQISDIAQYDGFVEAFKDCKTVFHLAAPVFHKTKDIVQIGVKGTLNACKAALECGLKRIVLTASMASVLNSSDVDGSKIYTDEDWNENPTTPYSKEKVEAEKVAWNFVKEHEELELATIHPSVVMGPALGKKLISSTILHHGLHLVDGSMKECKGGKEERFGIVSVHDVVEAHVKAMKVGSAKNHRYLVSNPEQWSHLKVAELIRKKFPSLEVPKTETESTGKLIDKFVDCSRVVDLLGHDLKKSEDCIIEMVQSFIDLGVLKHE
jgi:nucleoside-diphosphate-sugar epimerase